MKSVLKKGFYSLPDNAQNAIKYIFDYSRNAIPCFACNVIECFANGAPVHGVNASKYYETESQSILGRWDESSFKDTDLRYKFSLKYLKSGMKVLDCGCGSARLCDLLQTRVGDITYLGLEYDDNYLTIAKNKNRNVKKCDLNDLSNFEKILKQYNLI